MDFKSLLSKIDSIDSTAVQKPSLPEAQKPIQLNEDAELRVLAGRSTVKEEAALMEKAVSKSQQQAAGAALAAKKSGDTSELKGASKEMAKMSKSELEKIASTKHKGLPKKKTDESVEEGIEDKIEAAREKAKAKGKIKDEKPEEKKSSTRRVNGSKYGGSKQKDDVDESFLSKFEQMVEAAKKAKPDFADLNKDDNKKEPTKKAAKDAKVKEAVQCKDTKKSESKMMPKGKKRPVKESIEPKLSFRDMMKLVVESGGQQKIDPVDQTLWAWAQRVARTKLGEGMKAEVYAGLTYERMGGRFEMYDVLAETKK